MDKLKELIESNPSLRLLGRRKLVQALAPHSITKKVVDEYFKTREVVEIYKRPPKHPRTETLQIAAEPYSYQVDVVELPDYRDMNKGMTKFLLIVDICSRKAFAYILLNGSADTVLKGYKDFIQHATYVNSVTCDAFFDNAAFQAFNTGHNILVYTSVAKDDHLCGQGNKLAIVDRCVRTIKSYINKRVLETGNAQWTSYLSEIIELYNTTSHDSLKGRTPNDVYNDSKAMIEIYVAAKLHNRKVRKQWSIKEGDKVRVLVGKTTISKEKPSYSVDIYVVKSLVGHAFVLIDKDGKEVERRYKYAEMMKTSDVVTRKVQPMSKISAAQTRTRVANILEQKEGIVRSHQQALQVVTKRATNKKATKRHKRAKEWWKPNPPIQKRKRSNKPWWDLSAKTEGAM